MCLLSQSCLPTQKDLRELEGLAVGSVEGLGNVPHQLNVLGLVVTHRDVRRSRERHLECELPSIWGHVATFV